MGLVMESMGDSSVTIGNHKGGSGISFLLFLCFWAFSMGFFLLNLTIYCKFEIPEMAGGLL